MRAGKNINDAAEALLGMGSGFVDDDMMVCSSVLEPWCSSLMQCCALHSSAVCKQATLSLYDECTLCPQVCK